VDEDGDGSDHGDDDDDNGDDNYDDDDNGDDDNADDDDDDNAATARRWKALCDTKIASQWCHNGVTMVSY
jgi:hypothetical protein